MFEILQAADATVRFREPVLSALKQADSTIYTYDLDQLCDLAVLYARQNSQEAREYLYQIFRTQPDRMAPWMAEEQIVRLDGLSGFLYMAKERGKEFRLGGAEWDSEDLVSVAEEDLGADQTNSALSNAAEGDPDLRAFQDGLQAHRSSIDSLNSNRESHEERMRAIPVQRILDEIRQSDSLKARFWFLNWGRYASEHDLDKILEMMFAEQHAGRLINYVRIFARRPMPHFDERFIELTRHGDPDVREHAMSSLGENSHPAVRALALARLDEGHGDGETIGLLAKNYRPGDHHRIEQILKPVSDVWESHHITWKLRDVFTENKDKEGLKSMCFAYEESPCSACRKRTVALLIDLEILPDTLLDECHFDSNEEIRELVGLR